MLPKLAQEPSDIVSPSIMSSPQLPIGGTRAGGGMTRWASGRVSLHLRRVGVAGKPVGVAVRWFVHRPGFGVQGRLPSTAYLRGRAGMQFAGTPHNFRRKGTCVGGAGPQGGRGQGLSSGAVGGRYPHGRHGCRLPSHPIRSLHEQRPHKMLSTPHPPTGFLVVQGARKVFVG